MPQRDATTEWNQLSPEELQSLLTELGVAMSLEEAGVLQELLIAADDNEAAYELINVVAKAA